MELDTTDNAVAATAAAAAPAVASAVGEKR